MNEDLVPRRAEGEGLAPLKSVQHGLPRIGILPLQIRARVFFDQRRPEARGPAGLARNAQVFDPDLPAARLCPQAGADQLAERLFWAFDQTMRLWGDAAWRQWRKALSVPGERRA